MGRDKAALLVDGEPLWQRQLNTLRGTQPAEVFISGPVGGPYGSAGVRIVPDAEPLLGPLGGITAALKACATEWLLVLAVDLPHMRGDYLLRMVRVATQGDTGIIPVIEGGKLEPLGAVYPKRALAVAEARRSANQLKLADFISDLEARGWMQRMDVSAEEASYFTNWNSPEDVKRSA
jgi:molybdopterin-guanine dinucleotide biosynthesis protein A